MSILRGIVVNNACMTYTVSFSTCYQKTLDNELGRELHPLISLKIYRGKCLISPTELMSASVRRWFKPIAILKFKVGIEFMPLGFAGCVRVNNFDRFGCMLTSSLSPCRNPTFTHFPINLIRSDDIALI